jgi:hypothetical protein
MRKSISGDAKLKLLPRPWENATIRKRNQARSVPAMARDFSEVLQQAMEFYVAGQLVEARALLLDIVRADPRLEAGWMFLSYTLEEPAQKADCLRKVLAINPENVEAKAALEKMQGGPGTGPVEPGPASDDTVAPAARIPVKPPTTPSIPPVSVPGVTGEMASFTDTPTAAASAAPPNAPSPSNVPTVVHASPFTVDIDHANDDLSVIPDVGPPGIGAQAAQLSHPFINPTQQPQAVPGQKPKAAVVPAQKPSPNAVAPFDIPPQPGATGKPIAPVRKTGQLAQAGAQPAGAPVRKTGQLAQAGVQPAGAPVRKTGQLAKAGAQPVRAPVRKTGQLGPAGAQPAGIPPAKKKRGTGCTCLVVGIILVLILAGIGAALWITGILPALFTNGTDSAASIPPVILDTPTPFVLPPRLTDTPTPTLTRTPTISATPTQTQSPTLAQPDATVQADMDRLKTEVEDIRGLSMEGSIPAYVVDRTQAENILLNEYDRIGYRDTIQNDAKALAALGFIKPTYDLAKYALTRLADGVLGFYMPADPAIYIIGNRFAGMERWTFTHEYDHALVHSHYAAVGIMEDDPMCANDSQRCEAIRALVEGDAMLVMMFWRDQYASPYDERDIALYPYPFLLPPEQNTPPYVTPMVEFSYYGGLVFVGTLWEKGNWAEVNKAYENLPVSTEQILHPEKYLNREKPAVMKIPNLESALGSDWALVKSDSLGEYMSYLLLAYGADNTSQIPSDTAETAAAGWGGDHYLVFSSSDGEKLLLAAEWNWDTDADATQFYAAMKEHVDKRFRGETASSSSGFCWAVNQETTCLYRSGRDILWVLGPDLDVVTRVQSAYGHY